MKTLGESIADALRRRNMKQTELARLLGVAPATVHRWTHDQKRPAPDRLNLLCKVLGIERTPETFEALEK